MFFIHIFFTEIVAHHFFFISSVRHFHACLVLFLFFTIPLFLTDHAFAEKTSLPVFFSFFFILSPKVKAWYT